MATTKNIVELQINADGAINSIDRAGAALDKATKEGASLKQQLREMQKELSSLDPNTEKFQKLSVEAGKLKDQINDAGDAVRANAGPALESLGNNVGQLKDRLFNLDFEGVGNSLKGIGTSIGRISGKDVLNGIKGIGQGFASLGKALLTNPIFLIGAALASIVVYWDDIKGLADGVTAEQEKQLALSQERASVEQQQLDAISEQENILKLQGKSEREILDLKIKESNEAIKAAEIAIENQKAIKQAQIDAANRNKSIVVGILNFITAPITALLKGIDSIGNAFGQNFELAKGFEDLKGGAANLLFDPSEVSKEGDAAIAEAEKKLTSLKNQNAGFILQTRQQDKAASDARKEAKAKEAAELLAIEEQIFLKSKELRDKINADAAKNTLGSANSALLTGAEERFKIEEQQGQLRLQLLESQKTQEIAAIDDKYIKLRDLAGQDAELRKVLAEKNAQEVADIEAKYAKQALDARLNTTASVLGALSDLNAAFAGKSEAQQKAAFERNKALQIAQALIQTYQSATGAYSSQISIPTPDAPIRAAIAAGAAVISGLAQVAKIKATKFNSTGGGSSSGGGGSAPNLGTVNPSAGTGAPQFNPINTNFIQNRPNQITPRAFVLAGDVASAAETRQKVADLARL